MSNPQNLISAFQQGRLSRRDFIRRLLALGLSASALGPLLAQAARAQGGTTIQWWDIFLPLVPLHEALWNAYMAEHPEVTVQYALQNDPGMGEALQLAFRSGQAPDVHSLSGLGVPASALHREGWFAPLGPADAWRTGVLADALFEGVTVFGGQAYSFPTFSTRWNTTSNWFNRSLLEAAGFDPEVGPQTWAEVHEAARAVTEGGGGRAYGLIMFLGYPERVGVQLIDLASVAGAPGEIDPRTGAYLYNTEPYLQALEFLLTFQQEGSLHPSSLSLDSRQGRTRWAAGEAGMFFDGPWTAGVLRSSYPEVMDNVGVAPVPVPEAGAPAYTYAGPPGGTWWVSSQSEHPEVAADLLRLFTSREYHVGLAEQMDQPPLDLSAVEGADVHPTYRKVLGFFGDMVRLAPSPVVKNANTSQVLAEMRDITPGLGEIVQGVFSGAVRDPRQALTDYTEQMTAERERALGVVQARGVEVSLDDWVFDTWQPGEDYTPEDYG